MVVRTTIREDMSTSLEPNRLVEPHTSVLGQQLKEPKVRNIAQRAWVNLASPYAAMVVGPATKPAASQP